MRKTWLLFVVWVMICNNVGAVENQTTSLDSLLQQYNTMQEKLDTMERHIESINAHMAQVQQNTKPTRLSNTDWDEVFNLAFALISACGAFLTFFELNRRRRKSTLHKEAQTIMMKRIILQFYFNKTIIQSIILKMEKEGWSKFYPSEENLMRLKIDPNDLFFVNFDDKESALVEENKIKFKIRSYNSDIDIFCQHIKDPNIPVDVKRRDLDSIDFRIGHLTRYMIAIMGNLGIGDCANKDRETLYRSIENYLRETQIKQQKDIRELYPQRQFNYTQIYQPRLDYQTKTTIEQRWDPTMQSERFFFDKQRTKRINNDFLDLSEIIDWDIQFLLDPETEPETIRLLSYPHKSRIRKA